MASLREYPRPRPTTRSPRRQGLPPRAILTLLLGGAFVWSLTTVQWDKPLVHAGGLSMLGQIVGAMLRPALSAEMFRLALEAT